jgi:hypothetical protein
MLTTGLKILPALQVAFSEKNSGHKLALQL